MKLVVRFLGLAVLCSIILDGCVKTGHATTQGDAGSGDLKLDVHTAADVEVEAYVDEAIKYNSVDGEIVISQRIENDCYQISISDTGIGISAEDAPYIFEPFYRADKSRNRSTGGSGLGLAIAKEIIEGHNGSIEYHAREPQRSEFIIRLNLEENSH